MELRPYILAIVFHLWSICRQSHSSTLETKNIVPDYADKLRNFDVTQTLFKDDSRWSWTNIDRRIKHHQQIDKLSANQYRLLESTPKTVDKDLKKRKRRKKHRRRHKRKKRLRSRKEKMKYRKNRQNKKYRKKTDNDIGSTNRYSSIQLKNEIDVMPKKDKMFKPTQTFFDNEVHSSNHTQEFKHKIYINGGKKRWKLYSPHRGVIKLIVRTHNILRGKVQPPAANMLAMTWNKQAAKQAQKWAEQCQPGTELEDPSIRWTPTYGTCGQNVHVAFKKQRWSRVIRLWWSEKRFFHFGYAYNNMTSVSKYTQMVWYNSHKVGCGFSQCASSTGKMFYRYVCNYCPTGNDPRRLGYPYVKGRQCSSCPKTCRSICDNGRCKLCSNSCPFSDLWSNCASLFNKWKQWLCNTKTIDGVIRFKNCRATCQCQDKIT